MSALRTNDPARTIAGILQVAAHEFAERGLSGARIDSIAAATQTSKRMIYCYFGNKEGLYLRVLEESCRRMRETESALRLNDLEPLEALQRLVVFTFESPGQPGLHSTGDGLEHRTRRLPEAEHDCSPSQLGGHRRRVEASCPGRGPRVVPATTRSDRHPRVDFCTQLLQCVEPIHLRADLPARHASAQGPGHAARERRRHGDALRLRLTSRLRPTLARTST